MRKLVTFLFLCSIFATNAQPGERGMYFAKKVYIPTPLPVYEQIKNLLPSPVLEGNKEWVSLYWKAWEIAFSQLKSPEPASPLVSNWIDEGLSPQVFQWDTHFMAMFGRYANHIFPFIESHDNFYAAQHPDGMICRVINEADGADHPWGLGPNFARTINPPLFTWAEVETYKITGDKSRFKLILPSLEKFAEWLDKNRADDHTPHRLYWSNGQASGMDNTPRDMGRHTVDGDIHSATDPMGWIDMSTQMVMFYNYLSFISKELGDSEKSVLYHNKAQDIAKRINRFMWDEKSGLYYDVNPKGEKTSWITVASFWPMLANITTPYQSERLVKNIQDTALFWRLLPLPSLAANQPYYDPTGKYWRGGVWAPTNYMVVKGLVQQGYRDVAVAIAEKHLAAMSNVYKQTRTIWELYAPEYYMPATQAGGVEMCMPDFVGWSGLVPISMLIEDILGFEASAVENTLAWRLHRQDRHGIENFRFGNIITSLVCESASGEEPRSIKVTANRPYTLLVNGEKIEIKKGEIVFKI